MRSPSTYAVISGIALSFSLALASASEKIMTRSLTLETTSILLDGTERELPSGAVSSSLLVTRRASGALALEAVVNGLIGRDGLAYGFAQAKAFIPKRDQVDVPIEAATGISFSVSSTRPRVWNIVLSTDVSERDSMGHEGALTYQANFTAEPQQTEIFIPLADFKPVSRGKVVDGKMGPGDAGYGSRFLALKAVGFQVTRQSVPEGRLNLEPIEADLVLKDALVNWGNVRGTGR